jgi:hypothetical protein
MKRLPLNVQTLYADLAQSVSFSATLPASIYKQTVGGKVYLYAVEKHGAARVKRYLGPANDPVVDKRADDIRRAAADAKVRRTTVSMLKRAGVPAPALGMGRVLEAISNAGLFRKGVVLAGTGAYQVYSPLVGACLSHAASTTQDADLAAASLAVASNTQGEDLLDILERADRASSRRSVSIPATFHKGSGRPRALMLTSSPASASGPMRNVLSSLPDFDALRSRCATWNSS